MVIIEKDLLYKMFITENKSIEKISNELNCSVDTVNKSLRFHKINKIKSPPTKEELLKLYSENPSAHKIGEKLNLSHKTVLKYLRTYEIISDNKNLNQVKTKSVSSKYNFSKDELYELYVTKNMNQHQIAKQFGCSYSLINRQLKKFGITKSKEKISEAKKETNENRFGGWYTQTDDYKSSRTDKLQEQYLKIGVPENLVETYSDDDLFVEYIKQNCKELSISEIANIFHLAYSTVAIRLQKLDIHELINFHPESKYEEEICDILSSWDIKYEKHNRQLLNGKEIDIYVPDLKIGIEFNGSYWHSDIFKSNKYHQDKSLLALKNGIFLYQIFEYEWIQNKQKIINHLRNLCNKNQNKIYARQCEIRIVPADTKKEFLDANHIQGTAQSNINLGIYYNNELVSLMCFGHSRFKKSYKWELIRFCSLSNHNVCGAASKLFKYFVANYMKSGNVCVSYSDILKTKGTLYETLGFKYKHISNPSYVWWLDNNNVLTRYNTQIKNENNILRNRSYVKIYDGGVKTWVFRKE